MKGLKKTEKCGSQEHKDERIVRVIRERTHIPFPKNEPAPDCQENGEGDRKIPYRDIDEELSDERTKQAKPIPGHIGSRLYILIASKQPKQITKAEIGR